MIKVFNYWEPKKGWVSFDSYKSAKKYVDDKFHEYWLIDKDNCETCYMEIYNNGDFEVWCAEMGSWLGSGDESPYFSVSYGSRKDCSDFTPTSLSPRKDYILI